MSGSPDRDETLDVELARIGRRVRRWREERGLTLQELAAKSGLATSTVHKVESVQMVPSVAVILKLARGLGRPPGDLVHDGGEALEAVHQRAADRHPLGVEGAMVVERLSADLFEPALETWRVTVHPGVSSGDAISYDGEELVVMEEGVLSFRVGEATHELAAGDTLHFKADAPHRWKNESSAPARFLVTGTLARRFRESMEGAVAAIAR